MILNGLNTVQFRAVTSQSKSLLVLAGAGTGKTSVMTKRVAFLCKERGVSPHNILLLTFTKKASNEMKERLVALLGEKEVGKIYTGTFHGISLRILEQYGYHLGYEQDITVYDEVDQRDILGSIISELGLSIKIENVVAAMQGYASDCDRYELQDDYTLLFTEYRNRLKEFNAVDFTLLLTEVLRLFREFPEVYQHFHDKFRYVFVDEYQDVDRTQYYLHEELKPENIFCVGDMNQTIYSWRGSDMQIILEFEKAHEGSEVVILDQSYRCGSTILSAANSLISHNPKQYDIELWTERGEGSLVVSTLADPKEEAESIAKQINRITVDKGLTFKDMAILTRTHRQHEVIVETLQKKKIPYREIGKETNFWKKTTSRMIISVLKILHNQKNAWHFNKICRHVIYEMSEAEWLQWEAKALRMQQSVLQLLVQEKAGKFSKLLEWYKENQSLSLLEVIDQVLVMLPIQDFFIRQSLAAKAMGVLEVFVHGADWEKLNADAKRVPDFLSWLASQEIQIELEDNKNEVRVATIHAVKGLEFPVVFVAGMVEGKLPSNRAIMEGSSEEERRLCYVAVTRAKDYLYLTSYTSKGGFGGVAKPSRFLEELIAV